jgi:hypothetical protein
MARRISVFLPNYSKQLADLQEGSAHIATTLFDTACELIRKIPASEGKTLSLSHCVGECEDKFHHWQNFDWFSEAEKKNPLYFSKNILRYSNGCLTLGRRKKYGDDFETIVKWKTRKSFEANFLKEAKKLALR